MNVLRRLTLCSVSIIALGVPTIFWAQARGPSLWGTVYVYNPEASSPKAARGYQVVLYDRQFKKSRPSYTDSFGQYAHYGVVPERYLMRIFNFQKVKVWEQEVRVTSPPSELKPIVLRKP